MSDTKIALFDMDGTLADYDKALRRDLERLRAPGEMLLPDDLRTYISEHRHLQKRRWLINQVAGWWLILPKLDWGFEILQAAREIGFKIHVLTQGPRRTPTAWGEKLLWCQKHIDREVDLTITRDKGLVYGRVLVDDNAEYMAGWLRWRKRGLGIMPDTPALADFKHANVIKYDRSRRSGEEVKRRLQEAFDRPAGSVGEKTNPAGGHLTFCSRRGR